jgi:hypothetical protein
MRSPVMRLPLLATAASAAVLLAAGPASAATWTAPATISTPHTFISGLEAGSSGNGTVVADWGFQDGVGTGRTNGVRGASLAPGAGAFGGERTLPSDTLRVIPYAQRSVGALIFTPGFATTRARVAVAFGSADGPSLGTARTIQTDDVAFLPSMALASDGTGLVAWISRASGNRRQVKVSLRAPGGRFGAPSIISGTGRANSITTAVGPQGQRLVAFERDGRLRARYRAAGHSWGALQDLGPVASGTDNELAALVTSGGRAMVADVHRQLTEGGSDAPLLVDAWVQPVGATRFRAAQRLEQGGVIQASAPALVPIEARGAALAWVGADPGGPATPNGPSTRVKVSVMGTDGRFGAAQPLSAAGQPVKAVAGAAEGGVALISWIRIDASSDEDGQVLAALRPAFGAFGAPEEVSPHENASETAPGFLGPPAARRPFVAWASRPGGEGPGVPLAQIQTFVRFAQRQP